MEEEYSEHLLDGTNANQDQVGVLKKIELVFDIQGTRKRRVFKGVSVQ